MVAKAKFEPIGDFLSPETAFVQACTALDVAAMLAIKHDDVEGITNVAALYIELASRMMGSGAEDDEDVDQEALDRKAPLGFSPAVITPELVEEVELEHERVDEPGE